MQKDMLTIQNIKIDLKKMLKDYYILLIEYILIFSVLLLAVVWIPIFIYKMAFAFLAALLLYPLFIQIIDVIKLHKILRNPFYIVKDKMLSKEIRRYACIRPLGYYRLKFSNFGTYMVPDESYTWSSMFRMLHKKVYESSDYGDEFYLVLSKPHIGKILFAYNTKMFEME